MSDFDTSDKFREGRKPTDGIHWVGVILIVIGAAFLGRNLIPDFPNWLFRWEVILLVIGLLAGVRSQFEGAGWFVLVAIGGISMLDLLFPVFDKPKFTWATIAIAIGLYLILRPGTKSTVARGDRTYSSSKRSVHSPPWQHPDSFYNERQNTYREVIEATSVFSQVKKLVMSKDFKGGEVVSVFGGAEIDLSKADINGRVRLEATNILGGTVLIVPPNWHVQSEVVAILGGVEDKRDPHFLRAEPDKVLLLEGVCILGGIEIKNY